ncbi:unnamed protein product [Linum tenue]|uniref:Uncharacterized protein n=1 Tax=Linum tenue TaxID=586396 RepID=A0AAV0KRL7_9ROSI|nr:unnamed protein product [Linum tenue]
MSATMYAAAATAASPTSLLLPGVSAVRTARCSFLPLLPPRCPSRFSPASVKVLSESSRVSLLQTRATSSDETSTSVDTNEIFTDLKEKVSFKTVVVCSIDFHLAFSNAWLFSPETLLLKLVKVF